MKETAGKVFSIAAGHQPVPGCTTSVGVARTDDVVLSYYSLAAGTDISAESYAHHKLLIDTGGSLEAWQEDPAAGTGAVPAATWRLSPGDVLLAPTDVPVGTRSAEGCVYLELEFGRETTMNDAISAGSVFKLADLLPYQDGTIVNMDLAHNDGMKLALMSFDAGCALSEHAAPAEALVLALDGEGVIGYEGEEHLIHAGESFKFDKGGRHYVRADKRFKMALLLVRE